MSTGAQAAQQPTQTTTNMPSPQQTELMNLALPLVRDYAANVPERYQGQTTAGFTAPQVAGQQMALDAAGGQAGVAQDAASAIRNITQGNIWDPNVNPMLRQTIDASTRPIMEGLREQALPAIRDTSVASGGFGGSRQGVAEGVATGKALNAVGDTAAKVAGSLYDTNINAQLKAAALTPTIQQGQVAPAVTTSGVGDVQQALQQRLLTEGLQNFNYDQMAPFLQAKDIMGLVGGIPGGSTVSTANVPQANPWMQSLGGAATGAAAGSMFGPMGTAVGAGGGALLPWLFR